MDEIKSVLLFLQTLHHRDDLEKHIYSNLKKMSDRTFSIEEIGRIFDQKVHPELIKNIKVILQNFGVIAIENGIFSVNKDKLISFIKIVSIAKAARDYKWPSVRLKPFLYISPPNIITSDLAEEIDDISNLLIDLVSSATESIIIMSPFTNKVGLSSILAPLKVCKKLPSVSIYLTAPSQDQSMIIKQINDLVPTILANKLNIYFCTSESMEEDHLPHAKLLIVDSKRGYLGSANFTKQGLTSRFEVAIELNEQQSRCVIKLLLKLEEKGLFIKHNKHFKY